MRQLLIKHIPIKQLKQPDAYQRHRIPCQPCRLLINIHPEDDLPDVVDDVDEDNGEVQAVDDKGNFVVGGDAG
jgi:hypothetical protein